MQFYAHSTDNPDRSDWQALEEHLEEVANRAEEFASVFGAGTLGRLTGLLHDAGKATAAFQARLEGSSAKVDHATFGARVTAERAGGLGMLSAYAITGHHGGLKDGGEQESQHHYRLNRNYRKVPDDAQLLPSIELPEELVSPFRLAAGSGGFPFCSFDLDALFLSGRC